MRAVEVSVAGCESAARCERLPAAGADVARRARPPVLLVLLSLVSMELELSGAAISSRARRRTAIAGFDACRPRFGEQCRQRHAASFVIAAAPPPPPPSPSVSPSLAAAANTAASAAAASRRRQRWRPRSPPTTKAEKRGLLARVVNGSAAAPRRCSAARSSCTCTRRRRTPSGRRRTWRRRTQSARASSGAATTSCSGGSQSPQRTLDPAKADFFVPSCPSATSTLRPATRFPRWRRRCARSSRTSRRRRARSGRRRAPVFFFMSGIGAGIVPGWERAIGRAVFVVAEGDREADYFRYGHDIVAQEAPPARRWRPAASRPAIGVFRGALTARCAARRARASRSRTSCAAGSTSC